MNKMQEIVIDKVTMNIGTGAPGDRLDFAKDLIERLSGGKPIETTAKRREPVFKLRKGLPIGAKATLRKSLAKEFVDKALTARRRVLNPSNFDSTGNFSFGVAEYIDFPGAKYDPNIGMFGFDVAVTLKRRGVRIERRRIAKSKVGASHRVTKEEAIEFAKTVLNAKIE
jgi:large subunit ribosomal protein L5